MYKRQNEGGSAVLVNAPSNGNANGITTTDLTGSGGYSATNCTSTFGGTSSASPLTAGVVALMLDANPNLTWRDVQHILVNTSDRTDTGNTNWRKNASGRWISEYYGFGRVETLSGFVNGVFLLFIVVACGKRQPIIIIDRRLTCCAIRPTIRVTYC